MRLYTSTPLRSFAIGLVSLVGISINGLVNFIDKPSASANAQSFPSDASSNAGSNQYLVYLPNVANIKQAKLLAPDAFVSRLDTGEQVVQLGRFNNLNLAQRRAAQFSQAGLAPQIRTVQGKFGTSANLPTNTIPTIPASNPIPQNSAPIPVESIPVPTTNNNSLPGVPGGQFPNNQISNNQNNQIQIVRSPQSDPQPIPQPNQPFPNQNNSQPSLPIASQGVANTAQLRYFVIIPTGTVSELQRVQAIAPSAQLRSSYRGTYIEVQGHPDRTSAETLNLTIRRQGFDSRVVFF
ncbi:MAG: hypothetical protein ACOYN8_04790 [Pseudanabaena sp.]|jgi:hypothetical protein